MRSFDLIPEPEARPLARADRYASHAAEIKKLEFDLVCEAIKSHLEEKARREGHPASS